VDRVVEHIRRLRQHEPNGRQAPPRTQARFSQEALLPLLIQELESAHNCHRISVD
jgi:hypothetical protein